MKNYWKLRKKNLLNSFNKPLKKWLSFVLVDFLFLIIFLLVLALYIIFSLIQIKGAESLAVDAIPIMEMAASGKLSEDISGDINKVESGLKYFFMKFFISLFISAIVISLLVSIWSYIGLIRLSNKKISARNVFFYLITSSLWSMLWFLIILIPVITILKIVPIMIYSGIIAVFGVYLSIILSVSLISFKPLKAIKRTFIIGFKKFSSIAPSMLLCFCVLMLVNSFFIFFKPAFRPEYSLLVLIFMAFFISWSRFYIVSEIRGASDDF
ncbi:hypothetical protein HQ545_07360 [Candidatus Woesearchaeota archaeon]|nr:hypothetical protein [Candidatus Woesearchaeota archaeon]